LLAVYISTMHSSEIVTSRF